MTETIPTTDPCTVTATYHNLHIECPYDNHTDTYTVTIEWTAHDESIEYQSLTNVITSYEHSEISHEELATELANNIEYPVTVTVTGTHYELSVTVTA